MQVEKREAKMNEQDIVTALKKYMETRKREGLLERLREEKAIKSRQWVTLGIIYGERDGWKLGYEQFLQVDRVKAKIQKLGESPEEQYLDFSGCQKCRELMPDKGKDRLKRLESQYSEFNAMEEGFFAGWLLGVSKIWDEVKDRMDEKKSFFSGADWG